MMICDAFGRVVPSFVLRSACLELGTKFEFVECVRYSKFYYFFLDLTVWFLLLGDNGGRCFVEECKSRMNKWYSYI